MLAAAAALLLATGATPAPAVQKKAAPANWLTVIVKTPAGGFRQGNPDAPVKLVEYGSRTCPTCGRFAAEGMKPLRDQYIATGKVSYEYRDYLVHGGPDLALAILNQCVPTARFFDTLDAIYASQPMFADRVEALVHDTPAEAEKMQNLPAPQAALRFAESLGFLKFMAARGLPEAQARKCLGNAALIGGIATVNANAATQYGVNGTPTFFVNGRKMRANSWDRLQPELWAAGA
ncbi:protein-disulfide isomerase [Sphingomonas hengshuiensis]|uniref:Protein-disulfide isomerase n=1 Tax=Sphingomonas hengshuiensis TaxID=1609977 RepID=A0A7U5BG28_9SPHN|nr:protein-disulfide isomerase [Sphingomonas hengshuiensis]